MTTAREQAREAAVAVRPFHDSLPDEARAHADAASDVWEPIVRDLTDAVGSLLLAGERMSGTGPLAEAYNRAKEALDG